MCIRDRIKDIEFVEKAHENICKQTRRGGQSLEMKKMKEEQATIEKVLELLKSGKDVRHENWGPKEVCSNLLASIIPPIVAFYDEQELSARIIPALRILTLSNARCHENTSLLIYDS